MRKVIVEWCVKYYVFDEEDGLDEFFIVLPSVINVLWWFIRKGRKCCNIRIWRNGWARGIQL